MHPLSLFPELLTFSLIAPFILRITVGSFLLVGAWNRYTKSYAWSSIFYVISGILLVIGFHTQLSAILGIIVLIWDWCVEQKLAPLIREQKMLRKLMIIVLLSLLLTGPGAWAFDLPL